MVSPQLRKRGAALVFWVSLIVGGWVAWTLPPEDIPGEPPRQTYERCLLALSVIAINIEFGLIWLTTDVRTQQEDDA
jgi:hypothetical protein